MIKPEDFLSFSHASQSKTVGKQTHDLTVTASDSKTTQDRGR